MNNVFVESRIKAISKTVGIPKLNKLVYEEVRGDMKVFLEELLEKTLQITRYYKRKTVTVNDVYMVMVKHLLLETKKIPSCKNKKGIQICFHFAKAPFHRYVREICTDLSTYPMYTILGEGTHFRFEKEALDLIQYASEKYLLKLMYEAKLIALAAKRDTLYPKDLKLAKQLETES